MQEYSPEVFKKLKPQKQLVLNSEKFGTNKKSVNRRENLPKIINKKQVCNAFIKIFVEMAIFEAQRVHLNCIEMFEKKL